MMVTPEEQRQNHADYMRAYYLDRPEKYEIKKQYSRDYARRNRDKINARNRVRNAADPSIQKDRYEQVISDPRRALATTLRRYGVTPEDYHRLLAAQGGVCAICKSTESSVRPNARPISRLSIDHDHSTGRIRGLLCLSCNMGIGNLENGRLSRLHRLPEAAAAYLGWARVWVEVNDIPKSPKAQAIIDGWLGGEHEDSLASRFGITRKAVYYHLERNLTPMREKN